MRIKDDCQYLESGPPYTVDADESWVLDGSGFRVVGPFVTPGLAVKEAGWRNEAAR